MATLRIVCITKHPTHEDRYHRITHVGVGDDPQKASKRLDVETVIRNYSEHQIADWRSIQMNAVELDRSRLWKGKTEDRCA